jgi:predicted kinase
MMIGVPGSGKSTWIQKNNNNAVIISTDDIVEQTAAASGKTYNEVFKDNIKFATQLANERARTAFTADQDVIWDQTNINPKSRRVKLDLAPDHYEKIAVFFPTPDKEELSKRLDNRPGKNIPQNIMMGMIASLVQPTTDEGFDDIIVVAQ